MEGSRSWRRLARRTAQGGLLSALAAGCVSLAPVEDAQPPDAAVDSSEATPLDATGLDASGSDVLACSATADPLSEASLMATLSALAAPSLAGRAPGTRGDTAARAIIEARFRCLGLEAPGGAFQQPFATDEGVPTANVLGVLRGSDPEVAHEVIVVAAHHDHLGADASGIYLGANDDASGVAAVLGLAERLARQGRAPRRTIVFALFGAEESGFLGSLHYDAHPLPGLSLADTVFMINLDMIGRYASERRLYALHTFPGTPGRTLLEGLVGDFPDLDVVLGEPGDAADHLTFCDAGVPAAFFWTSDEACYHNPCDTAERIDRGPYTRTVKLVSALLSVAAEGDLDLAAARARGCGDL